MANEYQINVDTNAVEKMLAAFGASLDTGFEKTLKQIGIRAGRSIDLNFRNQGRPDKFKALSPLTVLYRREEAKRTGRQPVAGFLTPLRVTDNLRRAAIATAPGTPGSEVNLTPWGWSNEVTLDYAADQQFGTGRIPARPFFQLQEADVRTFSDLIQADINARLNAVQR